jgi:hypothetical protein
MVSFYFSNFVTVFGFDVNYIPVHEKTKSVLNFTKKHFLFCLFFVSGETRIIDSFLKTGKFALLEIDDKCQRLIEESDLIDRVRETAVGRLNNNKSQVDRKSVDWEEPEDLDSEEYITECKLDMLEHGRMSVYCGGGSRDPTVLKKWKKTKEEAAKRTIIENVRLASKRKLKVNITRYILFTLLLFFMNFYIFQSQQASVDIAPKKPTPKGYHLGRDSLTNIRLSSEMDDKEYFNYVYGEEEEEKICRQQEINTLLDDTESVSSISFDDYNNIDISEEAQRSYKCNIENEFVKEQATNTEEVIEPSYTRKWMNYIFRTAADMSIYALTTSITHRIFND